MICELLGQARQRAVPALRELRPDAPEVSEYVRRTDGAGYRLAGVVQAGEADAVAVAGFTVGESLAWGRYLYLWDLFTRPPHRGRGHATALMAWLVEQARHEGVDQLHLDSGVGVQRHDAHALYHAVGLRISSHHFSGHIPPPTAPPGGH